MYKEYETPISDDAFRTNAKCLNTKALPEIYPERSRRRGRGFDLTLYKTYFCNLKHQR